MILFWQSGRTKVLAKVDLRTPSILPSNGAGVLDSAPCIGNFQLPSNNALPQKKSVRDNFFCMPMESVVVRRTSLRCCFLSLLHSSSEHDKVLAKINLRTLSILPPNGDGVLDSASCIGNFQLSSRSALPQKESIPDNFFCMPMEIVAVRRNPLPCCHLLFLHSSNES